MIEKGSTYHIILEVGQQINNLEDDFQAIFKSFVLPCWLAKQYSIRILTSSLKSGDLRVHHVLTTPKKDTQNQVPLFFFETSINSQTHTIVYNIQTELSPFRQMNQIIVTFSKDYAFKFMNIRLYDEESFFERYFIMPDQEKYIKINRQLKEGQLMYPYSEPDDQRTKEEFENNHFHLAFQGGGSKGIAYLGAYKALMQLHPDYQIKSVIGSSAGGMISLGIAVGATPDGLFEVCKRLQHIPLDRTIKSIDDLTPEKKAYYKQIKAKIKKALHDYGFLCNEMFELLVSEVLTDDIIEKVFEILGATNESIKEMLTMEAESPEEEEGCSCCTRGNVVPARERVNRLVNFYGLLDAKLLSGRQLQAIGLSLLRSFLEDKLREDETKFKKIMNLEHKNLIEIMTEIDKISERLNLKQFYLLNGVEFTVTSVDLECQLLRFFNHKTTPDLPVCKAVLMTGSFPVAFEAMAWRKEWGKYYIHYQHYRRQIDLTGHNFTDGGMLANFPIIFLDNEEMRPMYFSHKPNDKTKLFGFGLDQINQQLTVEEQRKQEQTLERLQNQLSQKISKHLPIMKLLYYQMKHTPNPQVIPAQNLIQIEQIPIISFLFKLLSTYIYANDNLVCECFSRSIYQLPGNYSMAEGLRIIKDQDKDTELKQLRDCLVNIYNYMEKSLYTPASFIETVKDSIDRLRKGGAERQIIQTKSYIKKNLEQYLLYTQNINHMKESEEKRIIQNMSKLSGQLLEKLHSVNRFDRFMYCDTTEIDTKNMIDLCQRVVQLFDYLNFACSAPARAVIENHLKKFGNIIKMKQLEAVKNLIKIIHCKLIKKRPSLVNKDQKIQQGEMQKIDINDSDLTQLFSEYFHSYQRFSYRPLFKVFQEKLTKTHDWILRQQLVFSEQRKSISSYVENTLHRRTSNNIHLVFQSIGQYNKISFEIFKLVNEYIFIQENTKSAALAEKITQMILVESQKKNQVPSIEDIVQNIVIKSELLSFVEANLNYIHEKEQLEIQGVALLLSPELRETLANLVKQRNANICRVTSITCSSMHSYLGFLLTTGFKQQRIQRELQDMKYCFESDINQIKKNFDRKDWLLPFKCKVRQLQNLLWETRYDLFSQLQTATKTGKLSTSLQNIRKQFEASKEVIMDSYSDILEYLMASEMKASHEKSFQEYLASRMALKLQPQDYYKQNKQISENTKQIMEIVFIHFFQQVKFLVGTLSPVSLKEFLMQEEDPQRRQAMLKGFIISRFLKCDKMRKRIQEILKELNLPKDIKFKDFIEVVPRKIQITFTAVDTTNSRITFINHHTFPEMPLWAAIIIGSSFPVLFPSVRSQPDWVQFIDADSQKRFLKLFFDDGKYRRPPIFTGGNLLSSFPLQLLTNKKIRLMCFAGQDYTFLNFGVNRQKFGRQQPILKEFNRKFITVGEILSIGIKKFTKALFGMKEMIQLNAGLMTKDSLLETYLLSHDNLMVELYYKQLLRLPVRLGTLEFYKLGKKVEGQDMTVSQKTVQETFYATKEKFSQDKITYLQMRLTRGKMRVRFLSKQRSNKDIKRNYKIEYKLHSLQDWQPVRDQEIYFNNTQAELLLKFFYVDIKNKNEPYHPLVESAFRTVAIKEMEFSIELTTFLSVYSQYCGVFEFPYDKVFKDKLKIAGKPSKKVLRNIQRQNQAENIFECTTVVNLFKTGLYCHLCCIAFNLIPEAQVKVEQCFKCDNQKYVRFICPSKDCGVFCCFKCAKSQAILRTTTQLLCFKKHEFTFLHKKRMLSSKVKVLPSRCDLCLGFTQSYYHEKVCGIRICQTCCSEFTMQ